MKNKTSSNITNRKRVESKHADSKSLLSAIIDGPKDIIIFALDRNNCYTTFDYNQKSMF